MPEVSKKIIFPTDFSQFADLAFSKAKELALTFDAELFILHSIEAPSGLAKMFSSFDEKEARKEADKMLNDFIRRHSHDGKIKFNKLIKVGTPYKTIADAAGEITAWMVVMGTHGASGFQEFVGSNASRVIRIAPCPVMTIRRADENIGFSKIVLPLDLTQETGEKVSWGINLALKFKAELFPLSILQTDDEEVKKKLKGRLEKADAYIKKQGVISNPSMIVSDKDLPDAVLDYTEQVKGDMIVIMSQQEKKLREQLLGAYAAHIVNKSQVAVFSINPTKEYKESSYAGAHFS